MVVAKCSCQLKPLVTQLGTYTQEYLVRELTIRCVASSRSLLYIKVSLLWLVIGLRKFDHTVLVIYVCYYITIVLTIDLLQF